MDYSPPGSSVQEIFQARILEWVAISFSRGSSQPRGLNPGLLHCRQILYRLNYKGRHTLAACKTCPWLLTVAAVHLEICKAIVTVLLTFVLKKTGALFPEDSQNSDFLTAQAPQISVLSEAQHTPRQ